MESEIDVGNTEPEVNLSPAHQKQPERSKLKYVTDMHCLTQQKLPEVIWRYTVDLRGHRKGDQ
jgi:hypothetical protein